MFVKTGPKCRMVEAEILNESKNVQIVQTKQVPKGRHNSLRNTKEYVGNRWEGK